MTQYSRPQFNFAASLTPVVKRILIALTALWVVTSILVKLLKMRAAADILSHFELTPTDVVPGGEVWQVLTYSWLHGYGDLTHILFNGMALFFFGPELERRWGGRSFLKFYLVTGVVAGAVSVLVGLLLRSFDLPIVGASGAIFGLLAAWSILMPNREVLLFFVVPVKIRWLIWLSLGIDLALFLANGHTEVAFQTHAGGAIGGWLLITGNWKPRILGGNLRRLFGGKPKKQSFRVIDGGRGRGGRSGNDLLH